VSQKATEAALGRLICDDGFRREFYRDAVAAMARFGLYLTEVELESLLQLSRHAVDRIAGCLDDRIRRADGYACD
jgi:hypothetical protein